MESFWQTASTRIQQAAGDAEAQRALQQAERVLVEARDRWRAGEYPAAEALAGLANGLLREIVWKYPPPPPAKGFPGWAIAVIVIVVVAVGAGAAWFIQRRPSSYLR